VERREHIGQLLWGPYQAHLIRLHEALARAGYSDIQPTHGNNLFRHLDAEGSRITEIAERAHLTKQYIGNLAEYLEARGYVERVPDPTDGRAKIVRFTERGREVERVAEGILRQIEEEMTARIGAEKMMHLRALLVDLDTALQR
jgi:DNA-binding MarR family transcriptional regulator